LLLAAACLAASSCLGTAGEAQDQAPVSAAESLSLPSVAPGWRLGATLYGGWDSNPLDLPDGPSDRDYDLGANLEWGAGGRRGVFGLSADGSRLLYEELKDRNAWRGAATLTMGRRLSRDSVLAVTGGARYDYTDQFLLVPGISGPLPRTIALGGFGDGRLDLKVARRTSWSNGVRYEGVDFEGEDLVDTRSLRARSSVAQQVARRDHLSVTYEFVRAWWEARASDSHAALIGWKHKFSKQWSITIDSGASRLKPPDPSTAEAGWFFAGGAALERVSAAAAFSLSYRRSVTPGYGVGQLVDSDTVEASATVPVGRRVDLRVAGAGDRSRDPFDPAYRSQGGYLDSSLAVRLVGAVGLTASYRYHAREDIGRPRVHEHRAGLALTAAFESSRRRTRAGAAGR
jgi:hypothetical protein